MDNLTKKQRLKCMSRIRSKNTEPERRIRKLLTAENIKYRLHTSRLPGKPDIVMSAKKIAIFINGCFWHQHKHCKYAVMPKSNINYWKTKLEKNIAKQKEATRQLRKIDWKPIVIWECQVKKQKLLGKIINRIKNEKK